ncbi:MAG TPA: type II toxin-antitoxin system VapC family toxin [Terracidiphilus sp.]|nr:type II toxin-antitoxin system VapC family toxin [Terracidiphilus sp.]
MTGLDTNVLVRFFAQDDQQQSPKADEVMGSLTAESPGWVSVATILELVWVLGSKSRYDNNAITKTIDQLLLRDEIVIEQANVIHNALNLCRKGNVDFADCLIAVFAKAAGCSRTVTFDRKAALDAGMELIV